MAVVGNTVMNMVLESPFESVFSSFEYRPRSDSSLFAFVTLQLVSTRAEPFYIPTAMQESPSFSESSPTLVIFFFLDVDMKGNLIAVLICISPVTNDERLFMCLLAICILPWRNVCSVRCPFLNCVFVVDSREFSTCSGFYVFMRHLIVYTFYHSVVFFIFLIMSFDAQKVLIWMKPNISVFSFVAQVFVVISKQPLPNPRSRRFTPIFLLYGLSAYI